MLKVFAKHTKYAKNGRYRRIILLLDRKVVHCYNVFRAGVAQSVEQRTRNAQVRGSIPLTSSTTNKKGSSIFQLKPYFLHNYLLYANVSSTATGSSSIASGSTYPFLKHLKCLNLQIIASYASISQRNEIVPPTNTSEK